MHVGNALIPAGYRMIKMENEKKNRDLSFKGLQCKQRGWEVNVTKKVVHYATHRKNNRKYSRNRKQKEQYKAIHVTYARL